jgi:hypothetical protein
VQMSPGCDFFGGSVFSPAVDFRGTSIEVSEDDVRIFPAHRSLFSVIFKTTTLVC